MANLPQHPTQFAVSLLEHLLGEHELEDLPAFELFLLLIKWGKRIREICVELNYEPGEKNLFGEVEDSKTGHKPSNISRLMSVLVGKPILRNVSVEAFRGLDSQVLNVALKELLFQVDQACTYSSPREKFWSVGNGVSHLLGGAVGVAGGGLQLPDSAAARRAAVEVRGAAGDGAGAAGVLPAEPESAETGAAVQGAGEEEGEQGDRDKLLIDHFYES